MSETSSSDGPPGSFAERYRLYIDESGDHVFRHVNAPGHRFLCLLGCWFRGDSYRTFHDALENLKHDHFPHNPDEPPILHREDIVNCRRTFWRLRNADRRRAFDADLIELIVRSDFKMAGVVIDKKVLNDTYATPAHPYNLAIGFLLQRYCGFLNHVNRTGDVLAESRGGREDRLLKDSYQRVYQRGVWQTRRDFFQQALTSKQLKIKQKSANIAGLQIADLLAHPVRQYTLRQYGFVRQTPTEFQNKLAEAFVPKFNRHLYNDRLEGYGYVLFPKIEKG